MKLRDFGLLGDQNIREAVVEHFRSEGFDVLSAREGDLPGSADERLFELAIANGLVIVTHDRDFGRLAMFAANHPPGIVYLRPGHLSTDFTIAMVVGLLEANPDVEPPFLIVAEQTTRGLVLRTRALG